ncbi:MAG: SMC-Scp complex subunit ScpB [Phycisphaerae bacterium]|nr:SMC-Scp complex subunit ScpB [Phycisphaerae bacterium]
MPTETADSDPQQPEEAINTDPQPLSDQYQPEITLTSALEAVLFASDEPLTLNRLSDILETDSKQVRQCIFALNEIYRVNKHSFLIEKIAGGFQMLTLPTYNTWLRKLTRIRTDNKLTPAALETLAIIAYKQPVIRADVEAIRGVGAGEMIRSLMHKGMVKIAGRAEILGRPMLFATTKKFLQVFGLNTLKDLPKVEELKKPTR